MKRLVVFAVLLASVLQVARAQQSADDQYVIIYGIIQQADSYGSSGDVRHALDEFTEAQTELQQFQKIYPAWNPNIVSFRLNYIADKIGELTLRIPATNPPPAGQPVNAAANVAAPATTGPTGVEPAAPNADLEAQISSLQQQLQNLQANNTTLEAKLKEALGVQPAAIDPRQLDKAREQIRDLMKENDLLKVTLAQGGTAPKVDTNALAQLQQALALTEQKLNAQAQRAEQLAQENQTLQARVSQLLASPEGTTALREENAVLKKQLGELKAAQAVQAAAAAQANQSGQTINLNQNATADAMANLQSELDQAKGQIAVLQSNAVVAAQEKLSLQDRISQLQSGKTPAADTAKMATYEANIHDLTQERDDLLAKLGEANARLYSGKKQDAVARINELADQVNTLRARLAVDESQMVPYSAEELAMFKQPAPVQADPEAEKKSIKEMPEGSAQLVAEAQNYFAQHQYDKAAEDYQKILDRDENNSLALGNLATIELQQGKLDTAEKHIKGALAQSPGDAYNLSILGYVQFQQEKYDAALDSLSKAAKLDPANPEIENYLGVTLGHKGLRVQAETALRKAIQIDPNYGAAHNNLAVIYISETPPLAQLARWHYQKALDAGQPRNPALESDLASKGAPANP